MTIPTTGTPTPPPQRAGSTWVLTAVGGVAALVLIIGFFVWVGTRDDDVATNPTDATVGVTTTPPAASTTTTAVATTPAATVPDPTSTPTNTPATTAPATPPTTTPPTTTSPTTTSPATSPTTTSPATSPIGPTWTVVSRALSDQTLTLDRVVEVEGAAVYNGTFDIGENGLRCVVIAFEESWSELCTEPDRPVRFVAMEGIDPWLVDVGADAGDIVLAPRASGWTLPTNGCNAPLSTLIPADTIGGSVLMSLRCVPGDAVMSFANALLGPGPPDGLIVVAAEDDEGWNVVNAGTEIDCASADGVDRCTLYGVDEFLTGGLVLPPVEFTPTSADIIGVSDETSVVRGWTATETDPSAIMGLVSDHVVDPDDALEAPPTELQIEIAGLTLIVIVVPALDDSILSTTWAVWVAPTGPQPIVLATSWITCARGVTGDLCI